MTVQIVRSAVSPVARWATALATLAVLLPVGFVTGRAVFAPPSHREADGSNDDGDDAGTSSGTPGTQVSPEASPRALPPTPVPSSETPRVPVRAEPWTLQACGDSDELNIPATRCDAPEALDAALRDALRALGTCPAVVSGAGADESTYTLGLRVDFERRTLTPATTRTGAGGAPLTLVACARTALASAASVWSLPRPAHARYLAIYRIHVGPAPAIPSRPPTAPSRPTATPAAAAPEGAHADGTPLPSPEPVTVVAPVALLRDAPRTGAILARIAQGARLTADRRAGSWWHVRGPTREGWVFGEAIGR